VANEIPSEEYSLSDRDAALGKDFQQRAAAHSERNLQLASRRLWSYLSGNFWQAPTLPSANQHFQHTDARSND